MDVNDWATLRVRPGASQQEIRQAYLDLVKVWHPDRFAGNPHLQAMADQELQRLNAAYKRLYGSHVPATGPLQSSTIRDSAVRNRRTWSKPAPAETKTAPNERGWPLSKVVGGFAAGGAALVAFWLVLAPTPAVEQWAPSPPQPPTASEVASVPRPTTDSPATVPPSGATAERARVVRPKVARVEDIEAIETDPNAAATSSIEGDERHPRPETGTELLEVSGPAGHGRLTVSNGTDQDSVVVLYARESQVRAVFVRSGGDANIDSIPPAEYQVRFALGEAWDGTRFRKDEQFLEFDRPMMFTERDTESGVAFVQARLSLHAVVGGNARTRPTAPFRLRIPIE
jgi:hypothetical protein